ncbi:HDIG domain-containing protein [candidate division KSB3 bacterium]|uniref:HDIG domain-containing protein n=1 Tax=candidate division KSB3 bacterium TaxID=2044937 RepID=A0A9D5JZQ9_9BACT|nr:HDIG domain-containing protein [candidate division KSB3 bacterium]MBD3327078.1 HDIG domain-containing protein [candidate division KSB3 bacterium]
MSAKALNREEAYQLLTEYTTSDSLIKHALAVEAIMRAYARKFGEDEEKWGIVGLLHDFDYEQYPTPEDHPLKGAAILEEQGYPEDVIYAIKTHADYLGLPRNSLMDKTLFAVDELSGLLTAAALVQPNKTIHTVKVKSVKKKMKDKGFARSVNRDDIRTGVEELGVDLGEHIGFCIEAMRGVAADLELDN